MHAHLHILTHKAQSAPLPTPKNSKANTIKADSG